MGKYDSLADQVAEDFRMSMLAFSDMHKSMQRMKRNMDRLDLSMKRSKRAIKKLYGTVSAIVARQDEDSERLSSLEEWRQEVDRKLSA